MTVTVVNKYKEPNYIYCGRGSPVGNPFQMFNESQRDDVCDQYDIWFNREIKQNIEIIDFVNNLIALASMGNIKLGCFCAPKRCHCDTIKKYIDAKIER